MKRSREAIGVVWFVIVISCACHQTLAESYSIDWSKISGGGGNSTGGVYSVSGTIGQHDPGTMSGGAYSLTGGFWSLLAAVQTPGLPNLVIVRTAASATVLWANTGSFTLQQNTDLKLSSGWTTSGYTVTTANGTNSVTINNPSGTLFFRLKQ